MPPQTAPPLPVKKSVLRQLGIADNELPYGLGRLKHNLLLFPSHTPSQESNICTNSNLISEPGVDPRQTNDLGKLDAMSAAGCAGWVGHLQKRVCDTIEESPIACLGSKMETFRSMSYIDQIAIVCLASGFRACQAPDCLQYRRKLERVAPVCHSWPGLRDWVLCVISCSLCAIQGTNNSSTQDVPSKQDSFVPMENKNKYGLDRLSLGVLERLRAHLTACILLITPPGAAIDQEWSLSEMSEPESLEEAAHVSGSIGSPRPDQEIYSFGKTSVSSRRCPRFTPETANMP